MEYSASHINHTLFSQKLISVENPVYIIKLLCLQMEKSVPARQASYIMYNLCNTKIFYRKKLKGEFLL